MGSVKDLIVDDSVWGQFYRPPTAYSFGMGFWRVKPTFSVKDLKKHIPSGFFIPGKGEALTMMTAAFFEYLDEAHPEINTCYLGLGNKDGVVTDLNNLLDRGETTNMIAMRLAHTPDSYSNGNLNIYREAMTSGSLGCAVADVESIFRHGFPLGSSTFKRIFSAVGMGREYEKLSTYDEVKAGLDTIRKTVAEKGLGEYPKLVKVLADSGLGETIPDPGYMLGGFTFDSTTKFEHGGDRAITKEEEKKLSGLSDRGYEAWTKEVFPSIAQAQLDFSDRRDVVVMDGKCECATHRGNPLLTDFALTVDENRTMVRFEKDGVRYLVPFNKEIQRALYTAAGVDPVITEAKERATKAGRSDEWGAYFDEVSKERGLDLREVTEYSCKLMGYATAEIANRLLGKRVFDAPPMEKWVGDFLPYASRSQV